MKFTPTANLSGVGTFQVQGATDGSGGGLSTGFATATITVVAPRPNVYVDDNFPNPVIGQDPDGAGPATNFGVDSFATIQQGVNAVQSGGTVHVAAGNYSESPTLNQTATLAIEGAVTLNSTLTVTLGTLALNAVLSDPNGLVDVGAGATITRTSG